MNYRVIISDRAAGELLSITRWWAEHRSFEQAERWYEGFVDALASLAAQPTRCAIARENDQCKVELRQLNYSIGNRATHRAVFTIVEDIVTVLAIRHVAQQDMPPEDLP